MFPERQLTSDDSSAIGNFLAVDPQRPFVVELMEAPAGAMALAALEADALRTEDLLDLELVEPTASGVARAADQVRDVDFYNLMQVAVRVTAQMAGSYESEAPRRVARALRDAPARLPIAEAIAARFRVDLHEPLRRPGQHWWWMYNLASWSDVEPIGQHPGAHPAWLTAPINWFFTSNPGPERLLEAFGIAWDQSSHDVTRWSLNVDSGARIYEIHRPEDWQALVTAHPCEARTWYEGWQIASNDPEDQSASDELRGLLQQCAARWGVRRFIEADWAAVAQDWDAVHLSWAGFLTTEGTACDLGDGDVTMLLGWGSERTLWLNPVLSDPQPVDPDPDFLAGDGELDRSIDLRSDPDRFREQLSFLSARLGCSNP